MEKLPQTIAVKVCRYESGQGEILKTETAVLTTIQGHEVYVLESALNGTQREFRNGYTGNIDRTSRVYRQDGSPIWCTFTSRYGKVIQWYYFIVNTETMEFDDTIGRHKGVKLRSIDWDGRLLSNRFNGN